MIAIYLLWNNFGWVGCYSYGLICAMGYFMMNLKMHRA
jgi:hypothetical protein